jgi:hypothetical protein
MKEIEFERLSEVSGGDCESLVYTYTYGYQRDEFNTVPQSVYQEPQP